VGINGRGRRGDLAVTLRIDQTRRINQGSVTSGRRPIASARRPCAPLALGAMWGSAALPAPYVRAIDAKEAVMIR
jgi:hypothetical protein